MDHVDKRSRAVNPASMDPALMAPFVACGPLLSILALRGVCRGLKELCDNRMSYTYPNNYEKKHRSLLDLVARTRTASARKCMYFECDIEFCRSMLRMVIDQMAAIAAKTSGTASFSGSGRWPVIADVSVEQTCDVHCRYFFRKFGFYCSSRALEVLADVHPSFGKACICGIISSGRIQVAAQCREMGLYSKHMDYMSRERSLIWLGSVGQETMIKSGCLNFDEILEYLHIFTLDTVRACIDLFKSIWTVRANTAVQFNSEVSFPPMSRILKEDDVDLLQLLMEAAPPVKCTQLRDAILEDDWTFKTKCLRYLVKRWCNEYPHVQATNLIISIVSRESYSADLEIIDVVLRAGARIPFYFAQQSGDPRWMERLMSNMFLETIVYETVIEGLTPENIDAMMRQLSKRELVELYMSLSSIDIPNEITEGLEMVGARPCLPISADAGRKM